MNNLKLGLIQLNSGQDIDANYENFRSFLLDAIQQGAQFISTPEVTNFITDDHIARLRNAAVDENDRFINLAKGLAKQNKIHILIGSLAFRSETSGKCKNRSFFITPDGNVSAYYDKIHMFDVNLSEQETYRESDYYEPGSKVVVTEAEFGRLGMTICYDIRFPNLYTKLALNRSNIISVPSAFTAYTGARHWEVLLRARAIETGAFIVAAAQTGKHGTLNRTSYGNSMIISPGGEILLNLGTDPSVGVIDIDLNECEEYRAKIPSLRNIVDFS